DAAFAGAVGGLVGRHAEGRDVGAETNDGAAARLQEMPGAMLAGQELPGEIGGEELVPDRHVEPIDAVVLPQELDAGIRDDDVEPAPACGRLIDGLRDLGFDRAVGWQYQRFAAGLADLGLDSFERLAPACNQRDACTFGGEPERRRLADAGAGAGDDRPLSLEAIWIELRHVDLVCAAGAAA